MHGWAVLVYRPSTPEDFIGRWRTGANGLNWLDQLVKDDKAVDLGGNGYPMRYVISAGVLFSTLKGGLPANASPLILGDDYVIPEGAGGEIKWDPVEVQKCAGNDQLIVEAWDQS